MTTRTDGSSPALPPMPRVRDVTPRIPDKGLRGRDGEYLPDLGLIDAANVALTLELPLLLTGEPGCGKTDFAFAAANALGAAERPDVSADVPALPAALDPRRPLECHIRSDARARDLLYHYDAILRFSDGHHGDKNRAADARHYVELQALGIALTSTTRRVVLVDEIDKAPRDLPNDLLRELDRGEFEIPEIPMEADARPAVCDRTGVPLRRIMTCPRPMPLVVITSNVERELPAPFLRRCVFYHIPFPNEDDLRAIVRSRFPETDPLRLERMVRVFLRAREIDNLGKPPSTAELLVWTRALALHDAGVDAYLAAFDAALTQGGFVRHATLRWTHLPAYGCLFKSREDRDLAAARQASPA